jgi:hypothetical protein
MPDVIAELLEQRMSNLSRADGTPRCQHIKDDGIRCGSPAMRQRKLCYFHERQKVRSKKLEIPLLEEKISIQIAITRVCQALANGELDPKTASALLYGLQTAASNISHMPYVSPAEMVIDRHLNCLNDLPAAEEDDDEDEEEDEEDRKWHLRQERKERQEREEYLKERQESENRRRAQLGLPPTNSAF